MQTNKIMTYNTYTFQLSKYFKIAFNIHNMTLRRLAYAEEKNLVTTRHMNCGCPPKRTCTCENPIRVPSKIGGRSYHGSLHMITTRTGEAIANFTE